MIPVQVSCWRSAAQAIKSGFKGIRMLTGSKIALANLPGFRFAGEELTTGPEPLTVITCE
jgi:hypothetical protein